MMKVGERNEATGTERITFNLQFSSLWRILVLLLLFLRKICYFREELPIFVSDMETPEGRNGGGQVRASV